MKSIQLVVALLLTWIAKDAAWAGKTNNKFIRRENRISWLQDHFTNHNIANISSSDYTVSGIFQSSSFAAACKTVTGNVGIATDRSEAMTLGCTRRVKGSLMLKEARDLYDVSSTTLGTTDYTLWREDNKQLSNFRCPALRHVGTLVLESLPNNRRSSFLQTLVSVCLVRKQQLGILPLNATANTIVLHCEVHHDANDNGAYEQRGRANRSERTSRSDE